MLRCADLAYSTVDGIMNSHNSEVCKVMHIGKNNPRFDYEMSDKQGNVKCLKVVDSEKILEFTFKRILSLKNTSV